MAEDQPNPAGPDLAEGITLAQLPDGGKLVGHVGGDEILLVRRGAEIFAVAAHCTHYHGPLADGLVVGDNVRCPWHHACFDLRTGAARSSWERNARNRNQSCVSRGKTCRRTSSSSAAGQPDLPRPRG